MGRSIKKGPFVEAGLLKKIVAMNASGEKKKGAAQVANDAIREAILAEMEDNRLYTISEMVKELPSCAGMQNQRVSGLIRTMIGDTIKRTEDKRKAYFQLV